MHIMDKLIDHAKFTSGISQIRHAAFVAGKESSCNGLKVEIDFGVYDPDDSDSRRIHTTSLNDALLSFVTIDHASLLGLGHLDMVGMRRLCALEDVGEVLDGIMICEASGGDAMAGGDGVGASDDGAKTGGGDAGASDDGNDIVSS